MKPTRRSIWPARIEAGWKPPKRNGRPRGMAQADWFWIGPGRRSRGDRIRANGWVGGRDRYKPRKTCHSLWTSGKRVGGVDQYEVDATRWFAWIDDGEWCPLEERTFGHRRDAKRWVEAHPRRVRG